MGKRFIVQRIGQLLRRFGFDIRRCPPGQRFRRASLCGSLLTAHSIGFVPATVIDVGAARGEWSLKVKSIWADSRYILIDPLQENESQLARAVQSIGNATYKIAAVSRNSGDIEINIHPDMDGSSVFLEREANINGRPRWVPAVCLNDLCEEMKLLPPFLLKADVQGAELLVLEGATSLLRHTELVVLEVLLFDIYQGSGPQLHDVVEYMLSKGFVVWDIFGMGYRMIDNALCQVDMMFVKEGGAFRRVQQYATESQRQEQLRRLERNESRRISPL